MKNIFIGIKRYWLTSSESQTWFQIFIESKSPGIKSPAKTIYPASFEQPDKSYPEK